MDDGETSDSLDRALADIAMLQAAYPDEIDVCDAIDGAQMPQFPLQVALKLEENANSSIILEFVDGYPMRTGVQVASYRSADKDKIDAVARSVRLAAEECLQEGMEGGLSCCATAMEMWQFFDAQKLQHIDTSCENNNSIESIPLNQPSRHYEWITGEPLMDRKSAFVAHACRVSNEKEVREALAQLLSSSSKIQRATHNMYAWRLTEVLNGGSNRILKHDNDDDGEDGAGSRMALLLHQRHEDGVIVVVSRWFGGIHLGPKRFAHIVNVTRDLLIHCHEHVWKDGKM